MSVGVVVETRKPDPGVLGQPEQIAAERAVAEFRSGRPVVVSAAGGSLLAAPIDGLDEARLAAFRRLCAPRKPYLLVTSRRAGVLGIAAAGPLGVVLSSTEPLQSIRSLASDAYVTRRIETLGTGPGVDAAITLSKLAQRLPALLVAEGFDPAGFDPPLMTVTAEAINKFKRSAIEALAIAGEADVPIGGGAATRFVVFRDAVGCESVAVIIGRPDPLQPVPVRLHSACLTGDVFGSRRCDCGDQLRLAVERLEQQGGGVVLYLDQEGRGLGLTNKMLAYRLQDQGLDTLDANTTLGFDDDERDYAIAARMLRILGFTEILLMTNNPAKLDGLTQEGITVVGRLALQVQIHPDNRRYLTAKARRAGHHIDHLIDALANEPAASGRPR